MKKVTKNQKGFTLLEVIVVLAVLGALAAMLSPVVFRYIDDGNRVRAQNDVNTIAAAINQMYKDTGRWPFYASGTAAVAINTTTDAVFLTSNSACDAANGATGTAGCDTTAPAVGTSGWLFTGKGHHLASQLVANEPTYPSGRYRGPYLDAVPALDPWGRSYVVNIENADPAASATNWVIALSAGANGTIETADATLVTAPIVAGGDDIIARVK